MSATSCPNFPGGKKLYSNLIQTEPLGQLTPNWQHVFLENRTFNLLHFDASFSICTLKPKIYLPLYHAVTLNVNERLSKNQLRLITRLIYNMHKIMLHVNLCYISHFTNHTRNFSKEVG